jgi:type VI secretion system protein ImpI
VPPASTAPVATPEPPVASPPQPSRPVAPPPAAVPVAASPPPVAPDQFLQRLAQAAGLPLDAFASRSSAEVADQLGVVLRVMTDSVMQLLNARLQAKRMARSSSQTMIQALNNNPLKFAPSADEALKIMFGPPSKSYLDARRAIEQSFADLKTHQIKTYAAMQHAFNELMGEINPEAIEQDAGADRGIAGLMTSRKAKMWDAYVARWQAMARRDGDGLVDSFMRLFAEHYDQATS